MADYLTKIGEIVVDRLLLKYKSKVKGVHYSRPSYRARLEGKISALEGLRFPNSPMDDVVLERKRGRRGDR